MVIIQAKRVIAKCFSQPWVYWHRYKVYLCRFTEMISIAIEMVKTLRS